MDALIKITQLLLSLSILIVLHELGHYLAARLFKTRVEKFFLFFDVNGKKLFSFTKGDTEYGIGWLPLGGYVKISGMIDESMDKEQMKLPPKPYEFRSKPAWQRLIIMLAGVAVNFILGLVIFISIVYVWGEEQIKPEDVTLGYTFSQDFKDYGFQDGDIITHINNKIPEDVKAINFDLLFKEIKTISVKHENGNTKTINIPEDVGMKMWVNGDKFPFSPRRSAVIDTVIPERPAGKAGFKNGDRIISVNGESIGFWHEFQAKVKDTMLTIEIMRNTEKKQFELRPEQTEDKKRVIIGVSNFGDSSVKVTHQNYTFKESISRGITKTYQSVHDQLAQFKYIFTSKGAQEVGGFISIGKIFPSTWNWQAFWAITGFLSIMLAVLNLLPIPALDGGHALFVLFEMITGKKPSEKFLEYAQIVGFIMLITLLLWANGNDIYKELVKLFDR